MQKINEWSAKRAGATMTILGTDADTGAQVRITGVLEIKRFERSDGIPPDILVATAIRSRGDAVLLA